MREKKKFLLLTSRRIMEEKEKFSRNQTLFLSLSLFRRKKDISINVKEPQYRVTEECKTSVSPSASIQDCFFARWCQKGEKIQSESRAKKFAMVCVKNAYACMYLSMTRMRKTFAAISSAVEIICWIWAKWAISVVVVVEAADLDPPSLSWPCWRMRTATL